MITAYRLSKSYPNRFLFSGLSFTLGKGICLIEGPSGCGKTTLLRILSGLEKPTEGKVLYSKNDFSFSSFGQEASLYGERTLSQNIRLFKKNYSKDELESILSQLDFSFSDRKLNQLSGGERQKAEIAFCLSKTADAYILDEPFVSLDKESKERLVTILNRKAETSLIILVNHDTDIKGLSISSSIRFISGRKEEKENPSYSKHYQVIEIHSLAQDKDIYENRKKEIRVLPNRKHYFSKRKGYSLIRSVFGLASRILFFLGLSQIRMDNASYRRYLYERDPFSVHRVIRSPIHKESKAPDASVFDIFNQKGIPYRNVDIGNDSEIRTIKRIGAKIQGHVLYSPSDDPFFSFEDTFRFSSGSLPLIKAQNSDFDSVFGAEKPKDIQEIIDGYASYDILILPKDVLKSVLLDSESVRFGKEPDYSIQTTLGCSVYVSDKGPSTLSYSPYSSDKAVIEDKEGYSFSSPLYMEGYRYSPFGSTVLAAECKPEDGKTHISLSLRELLRRQKIPFNEDNEQIFGYYLKDSDITLLNESMDSILRPRNVLRETNCFFNTFLYFIFASASLAGCLFFSFFAIKGEKTYIRSSFSVYEKNGFASSSFNLSRLLSGLLEWIPQAIISILLYFFLFLPRSNRTIRKENFHPIKSSFYYYSQQPNNPYYDSIKEPFKVFRFNSGFFFVFLIGFLFILSGFLSVFIAKKKKSRK